MKNDTKISRSSKFRAGYLLIFAVIIGFVGYRILNQSKAADTSPTPPTIYVSPQTQNLALNSTFTVTIRENSGTSTVNALQANISYPSSLLQVQNASAPVSFTGSPFATVAENSSTPGQVTLGTGTEGGASPLTGDQLVGTITFKAIAGGTANLAFTTGTALLNSTTNTDLLGSLSATRGSSVVVDTASPTVAISSPTNGATIAAGSTQNISITATDNTGVSSVDLYIDNVRKTTLSSPYTYTWDTTGLSLGSHTIEARATDAFGNVGTSGVKTVTITDQTKPTVSVTAPTNGTTVKSSVNITATAADNSGGSGLAKVEIYVDGALKSSGTTSPLTYSWDTTALTDGTTHTITAKAYDKASPANTADSQTVTVTVDNADKTAPTSPTGFKTTSTSLNSISLSWGASTDNVGVTGYKISRNGQPITTVTSLTYTDTGLNNGTSYNYSVVAIDAAGNSSTAATLSASTQALKAGDINQDGSVSATDLSMLLAKWGSTDATADLNQNGKVDIYDLSIVLSNYGK